jgi:hypothetical protein
MQRNRIQIFLLSYEHLLFSLDFVQPENKILKLFSDHNLSLE